MAVKRSINDIIPQDVIHEIFLHCIPADPLKFRQPNVTIAPILLCHVCSHWREIAFRSPHIWAHLYHVSRYLQNPVRTLDNRDLRFLKWWRDKVKCVPPSLRLEFEQDTGGNKKGYQAIDIDKFLEFIVQFIHTARYLNLDVGYNHLLRTLAPDSPQPVCPNLDTLIVRHPHAHETYLRTTRTVFSEKPLVSVTPKQHLRRLFIEKIVMEAEDSITFSNINFSILTHLHLESSSTTLEVWFSLLKQSVNLEYGSFYVTFDEPLESPNSFSIVLPRLRQMAFKNLGGALHQSFLDGFQLPSLLALRIKHFASLDVAHLHRILSSAPALQTLQLGVLSAGDVQPGSPDHIFIEGDLAPLQTPISDIVPHLSSIHFQYGYGADDVFIPENRHFVISVLTGDWLQVGRPGNRISRIELSLSCGLLIEDSISTFIRDLQSDLPAGLDFSAWPADLPDPFLFWDYRHHNFTDGFEDMMLDGL